MPYVFYFCFPFCVYQILNSCFSTDFFVGTMIEIISSILQDVKCINGSYMYYRTFLRQCTVVFPTTIVFVLPSLMLQINQMGNVFLLLFLLKEWDWIRMWLSAHKRFNPQWNLALTIPRQYIHSHVCLYIITMCLWSFGFFINSVYTIPFALSLGLFVEYDVFPAQFTSLQSENASYLVI